MRKLLAFLLMFLSFGLTITNSSLFAADEGPGQAIREELPDTILYIVRQQYKPDHHNTATMFQPGEVNLYNYAGGGAMKLWFPKSDITRTLVELPEGIIRDPVVSFDATKVLFSFRKGRDDYYHLGELDLTTERPTIVIKPDTDTKAIEGFRQLTWLDGACDIDPLYLPTGEILFSSTREPKYCMCNRHIMCNLFTMNGDGSNVQQIGKSTLFEGHASLLSDGRVIYDRWEYVDRNFGDAQGVWVCNPDGSKHEIFWGNNTASPGGAIDARIMPESDSKMVCVFGSCHDRPWGAIALVDRRLGIDGRDSVLMTWPPEAKDLVHAEPGPDPLREVIQYDYMRNLSQKFEDPCPLSDDLILAAGQTGNGEEMGLWALTTDGQATLLHTDAPGCYDPVPVQPTEPPMTIGNRIDLNDSYGYFHVTNVYEGLGMEKVAKGTAKYLRVVESPEKRYWTYSHYSYGNGQQGPGMAWDDFNNKRILGTVPVEEDGSVSLRVPAEKFVYFQLLDEKGMMIQSMRSGIMVRPGETNACVGCHESRLDAPTSLNLSPMAQAGEPKELEPWHGPERQFCYLAEVQPVFDKYCVGCHDYGQMAEEKLVLAGDRMMLFNASYSQIRGKNLVRVPGAGPHNKLPPYTWGSTQSRLAQILMRGHDKPEIDKLRKERGVWFDPQTDPEAFDRVVTWIDINAPYYPEYSATFPVNQFGRSPFTHDQLYRMEELVGRKQGTWQEPKKQAWLDSLPHPANHPLTWAVSLTRPELSPCLKAWSTPEERESAEYKEVLALIQEGAAVRATAPDDDATGPLNPNDVAQEARYQKMREKLQRSRNALLNGEKVTD
ncbi:MAG: hypothetical protein Q4G68_03375 [Planctomycetia bacterium]|nr:hypothetical protein [Planctomycetia bacterium]